MQTIQRMTSHALQNDLQNLHFESSQSIQHQ